MRRESAEVPSGDGQVTLRIAGEVAHIEFDRPWARNAMTWEMYDGLAAACAAIDQNRHIRVAVLRGAGGKAFVAGTDIAQFRDFTSGNDGLAYEAKLDSFIDALERLRVPSIAVVEGFAVGAGLAIANTCDIRIAAFGTRFGVPIARTLGNCLSAANLRRLCATLGISRVKRMLLLAEMPTAEAIASDRISGNGGTAADARRGSRAALRPIARACPAHNQSNARSLAASRARPGCRYRRPFAACYGSADFRRGAAAFGTGTRIEWEGR